jgi:hypothetical protein
VKKYWQCNFSTTTNRLVYDDAVRRTKNSPMSAFLDGSPVGVTSDSECDHSFARSIFFGATGSSSRLRVNSLCAIFLSS